MAADAAYLRAQAVRMFQFAIATRDAELSQELTHRAIEYLDQAMELEREQAAVPQHSKSDPEPEAIVSPGVRPSR
jgi:hypothetical protein